MRTGCYSRVLRRRLCELEMLTPDDMKKKIRNSLSGFHARIGPVIACLLFAVRLVAQQPSTDDCRPAIDPGQYNRISEPAKKQLFRIEVDDAIEAELITQQLKIKPQVVEGRSFFYCGDEEINKLLGSYGYEPSPADAEEAFSKVVRVAHKGNEEDLRDCGILIVLREREYWVVRVTLKQLRVLHKLGYPIREIGRDEPRPRQIRVTVHSLAQVAQAGRIGVDIYSVGKAEKEQEGLYVYGGAFDNVVDELQKQGFKVELLPDPPGVTR